MKRADLIRDFEITKNAIDLVQTMIDHKIAEIKLRELQNGKQEAIIRGLRFCKNKIQEIALDMEFNKITWEIKNLTITDIDKIVHKNGKFKIAFELKSRDEVFHKYIPLNAPQYILNRELSKSLGIPFFYLISLPKGYFVKLELRDGWKFMKVNTGDARGSYALAPISQAEILREKELQKWIYEILEG